MDSIKVIWALLLCCVYPTLHSTTDNRIIGGRPANEKEIPYQVSLRRSYSDEHFCGGTLITSKHILTAAHCMYYTWGGLLPPMVVSVVAGQLMLPLTNRSVYRNASLITVHAGFNKTSMTNDIAIIEVEIPFPVESNPLMRTVRLRNDSANAGLCFVSGWGVEKYGSSIVSEILLVTEVNVIEFIKCQNMYKPNVTLSEGMLCAGHVNGTTDACKGDSGGPLVCNGQLTGIVSTGSGCGSAEFPGIYTEVARFIPWIRFTTEVNASAPHNNNTDYNNITPPGDFFSNKMLNRNHAGNTANTVNLCILLALVYLLSYKL